MSGSDRDRFYVIRNVLARKMKWCEGGEVLDLSMRQIGYLCARVKKEGDRGVIHRLRGQPSNHRLEQGYQERALKIIREWYPDFGPTLACEKLEERHGISISVTAVRQAMIGARL